MAHTFDLSHAPFDRLFPAEAEVARAAAEIGYFGPGETILPDSLFMVLKGCFEERKTGPFAAVWSRDFAW